MSQVPKKSISHIWDDPNIFIGNSRTDMEKLRQAIEDLSKYNDISKAPIFTIDEVKQARKACTETIKTMEKEIERYDEVIKFIDGLPFKEGDVAFHREYGNVIISGVCINENLENSTYSIVIKTGRKMQVQIKDVLPISETTKVLFGKE